MNEFEDMIALLKACAPERDARSAALTARNVACQAMAALYRKSGAEMPDGESFLDLMSGKCVRAAMRERGISAALEYVRVLGSHAMHEKRVTKNAAIAAVAYAASIVAAVRETAEPKADAEAFEMPRELTEAETRKEYIDLFLSEAGWELVGHDNTPQPCKAGTEIKVTGMPPSGQDGFCDYVLYGRSGLPLAVVEAKRTSESPEKGRKQALLYAERLADEYFCQTPVVYYTNGYRIWCIDGVYPDRELSAYHTLGELEKLMHKRHRAPIRDFKVNRDIAGRPYQITAVTSLCEWFNDMHRRGLLVMATGTGKTRVSVSLVDVLSRNSWVEHVLFLADRTELVDQAKKAFVKLMPSASICVLSDKSDDGNPDTARLVFST